MVTSHRLAYSFAIALLGAISLAASAENAVQTGAAPHDTLSDQVAQKRQREASEWLERAIAADRERQAAIQQEAKTGRQAERYSVLKPSDPNAISRLENNGIDSVEKLKGLISRMNASGYSTSSDDVEAFLEHETEGRKLGMSATKYRDKVLKDEARAERQRVADERQRVADERQRVARHQMTAKAEAQKTGQTALGLIAKYGQSGDRMCRQYVQFSERKMESVFPLFDQGQYEMYANLVDEQVIRILKRNCER